MTEPEQSLLTCTKGILEKPPQWLIPRYVPRGNLTSFEGSGGEGKTMMGVEIIAKTSRGEKVFFDQSTTPPITGGSIILAAEDSYESNWRPKLRLAGAELDKVFFLQPSITDSRRLRQIEKELHRLANRNISILFIDPLSSFTRKSLTVESSARQILDRLGKTRHTNHNLAVIVVRHLTKNESTSLSNRGLGSVGIGARARSAFMFLPDPKDNTVKLMLHVKHNWSEEQRTPRFEPKVVGTEIGIGNEKQHVDFALVDPWGFSPLTVADFAGKKRTDGGKLGLAQETLESMSVGVEIALDDLLDKAGCGRRTLAAAKEILVKDGYIFDVRQVGNNKSGNDRQSFWILVSVPQPPKSSADPNVEPVPRPHPLDSLERGDVNAQPAVEECNPASVLTLPKPNKNGQKRHDTDIPKPHIPTDCRQDEFIES